MAQDLPDENRNMTLEDNCAYLKVPKINDIDENIGKWHDYRNYWLKKLISASYSMGPNDADF